MNSELIDSAKHEDNATFWEYIAEGQFRMQQCSSCQRFRYPASFICSHCSSVEFKWEPISGKGEVFTYTIMHKVYHPAFKDKVPYNISVIKLDENVHFLSNVECNSKEISIGMRVKAVLRDIDEKHKLPQFVPAEENYT